MSQPPLTRRLNALPTNVPFVGPETLQRQRGRAFAARMGANENGFGPSPHALAAMRAAAEGAWMYGDPTSHDLIAAIAKLHGVDACNVVVGEGIDGLLGLTVHLAVEPDGVVVTSDGAYPTFNFHVASHGGQLGRVPYLDDREDVTALIEAAHAHNAAIVYIANPDNPMGSWNAPRAIEAVAGALPPGCLLCLDEAYIDTLPLAERPSIAIETANVLRFRTFSKAYGLAGARVGYALGPQRLIAAFEKVRNHYGVSRMGQIGAWAALEDQPYLEGVVAQIAAARESIGDIARAHDLAPLPSASNFVAIDCGSSARAKTIMDGLMARDIFIRRPMVAPLDRCIRVSCAPPAEVALFGAALPLALGEATNGKN